ncbi:MAG TPA: WxcM-like domain-containing protein [Bryobacteraceae bacterium]|nr:WxcM-like domain-containing protein [Bryobacteraceae bacterium]
MLVSEIVLHPSALVETDSMGAGTSVGAFTQILRGARIGAGCRIGSHVLLQNGAVVGDRVTIESGVQIWAETRIEDDAFIGPNATFANRHFTEEPNRIEPVWVKSGACVGANATLLPGITIGERAIAGAGAVVTRSVPPHAMVAGNPARIIGYIGASIAPAPEAMPSREPGAHPSRVAGVTIHRLPLIRDLRGLLTVAEPLAFEVKRYFLVFGVPSRDVRGEHAHLTLHQFMVCVHGECHLIVDDGFRKEEIVLNSPGIGVHVPPMVWAVQYRHTPDAVLMVLASDIYKPEDYIRDYSEFRRLTYSTARASD